MVNGSTRTAGDGCLVEKKTTSHSSATDKGMDNTCVEYSQLVSRFSVFSTTGMAAAITATPLTIGLYQSFTLGVGGSPFFLYCYIVGAVLQLCCCCSLAELASALPHVSGQMYWATALAPKRMSRFLGFTAGAFSCLFWCFAICGAYLLGGRLIMGIVSVCRAGFTPDNWHVYLAFLLQILFVFTVNVWVFNHYPKITKILIVSILAFTIYLLVALLVRTNPKATAKTVFVDIVNETGWESNGLVFFLGFLPSISSVGAFDAAAHMAEEIPRPDFNIPIVMISSTSLNAVCGLAMVFVYTFCTSQPEKLLAPIGGEPILQLFKDSLRSKEMLVFTTAVFAILILFANIGAGTTASRVLWTFADHDALPAPSWQRKVNQQTGVPVNSVISTTTFAVALATLQFGPTYVLNAVIGAGVICANLSYAIPILLLVIKGRSALRNDRSFNMGRFGYLINIVTLMWNVILIIFLAFPLNAPVTVLNMNYASAGVLVSLIAILVLWVFYARDHYLSPNALFVDRT